MSTHDNWLCSSYYTPRQLIALGRIAELSAQLEVLLRQVLQQVMGLSDSAGQALFLGDRASVLVNRIKALGEFADMPPWFRDEAVEWAKRAGNAIEKRDDLLHRAPIILVDGDDEDYRVVGWNRSRRVHQPLPIDETRLRELVESLAALEKEALDKLMWGGWEESVGGASEDN